MTNLRKATVASIQRLYEAVYGYHAEFAAITLTDEKHYDIMEAIKQFYDSEFMIMRFGLLDGRAMSYEEIAAEDCTTARDVQYRIERILKILRTKDVLPAIF